MKILVVQLLRLGDLLMTAPILGGLEQAHPGAEIHVLAFSQFRQAAEVLTDRVHWHWIDREKAQKLIADRGENIFAAADAIGNNLGPLMSEDFDLILNLSHTRFSGWICSTLRSPATLGLSYSPHDGSPRMGSPWFQYLNDYVAAGGREIFHYLDIFWYACGLTKQEKFWSIRRKPIEGFRSDSSYVVMQLTTSDPKKTYPLPAWREVIRRFRDTENASRVVVLAGPGEAKGLRAGLDGLDVEIVDCDLAEALWLVDHARCLITGDTSLKHLACASKTPVLELSLGCADFRKTGVYKDRSLIMQSKAPCAPCPHSEACTQSTHQCAEMIPPTAVASLMHAMTAGSREDILKIGREFAAVVDILETTVSPTGFWIAGPMIKDFHQRSLSQFIEKSTLKFLLQREYLNPVAEFGTESLNIKLALESGAESIHPPRDLLSHLDFLESETAKEEADLSAVHRFDHLSRPQDRDGVVSIAGVRRLQNQRDEMFQKIRIKLKLIRSLKTQLRETI